MKKKLFLSSDEIRFMRTQIYKVNRSYFARVVVGVSSGPVVRLWEGDKPPSGKNMTKLCVLWDQCNHDGKMWDKFVEWLEVQ